MFPFQVDLAELAGVVDGLEEGGVEGEGEAGGEATMEEEAEGRVSLRGGQSIGGGRLPSTITRQCPPVSQTMSNANISALERKLENRVRLIFKASSSSSTRCTIPIAISWIVDTAISSQLGGLCKRILTTAQKMETSLSLVPGLRIVNSKVTMGEGKGTTGGEVEKWRLQGGSKHGSWPGQDGLKKLLLISEPGI